MTAFRRFDGWRSIVSWPSMEPGRRGSPVNAMVQKVDLKMFAMTEDSGKEGRSYRWSAVRVLISMNWWTLVGTAMNLLMVHAGPVHPEEEVKKLSMTSLWTKSSIFVDEGFMRGRLWSYAITKAWSQPHFRQVKSRSNYCYLLIFQVTAAADFGCHILHMELKNQEALINSKYRLVNVF